MAAGVLVIVFCVSAWLLWPLAGGDRRPVVIPPPPAPPVPNGMADLQAAARLYEASGGVLTVDKAVMAAAPGHTPWGKLTADQRRKLWPVRLAAERRSVAANGPALARMRVGLAKPCAVENARSSPGLNPLRPSRLSSLLRARMEVQSADGDYAGAVGTGLDGFELASAMARHGVLENWLMAVAVRETVRAALVANVDHLTAADAARLGHRLDRLRAAQPTFADVLEEERAVCLGGLAHTSETTQSDKDMRRFGGPFVRLQIAAAQRQLDTYFRDLRAAVAKPAAQRGHVFQPTHPMAILTAGVYAEVPGKVDREEAMNRLLRCQLAIQAYRGRTGRLPASLKDLGLPAFWSSDPYTGAPFLYRPGGRDYLLYSVGPNLRDDGGKPLGTGGDDVGLWSWEGGAPIVPRVPDGVAHMAPLGGTDEPRN